jgi:alkylation response protein AidB-like acyl-CoA dehydrogenase
LGSSNPNARLPTVRELADHQGGVKPKYLTQAAELGWFAFFVPDELGGGSISGAPVLEACIVAEERGRALQPGPFVAHNVVAWAVAAAGAGEQRSSILPALASAQEVATWAVASLSGSYTPGSVTAAAVPGGFALNGTVGLVEDACLATWILAEPVNLYEAPVRGCY